MKWISETHGYNGHPFKIEGWHLENQKDYEALILCKKCGTKNTIEECLRNPIRGYLGDIVAAPISQLFCHKCVVPLGTLDESDQKFTNGPVPLLVLEEKNCELCFSPT